MHRAPRLIDQELISSDQLAKLLGTTRNALATSRSRRRGDIGQLSFVRFAGRVYYLRDEVEQALQLHFVRRTSREDSTAA